MRNPRELPGPGTSFVNLCLSLERIGARIGVSADVERKLVMRAASTRSLRGRLKQASPTARRGAGRLEEMSRELELGGLRLKPGTVLAAAKCLSLLLVGVMLAFTSAMFFLKGLDIALLSFVATLLVPFFAKEQLMSYPSRRAAKSADEVLRSSSQTTNLMIMSLRHEPSISRAIAFASAGEGRFPRELKACAWGVIMGRYASFEEALIDLGQKWSRFSGDLKASLNAMVTASRESTEDGKRRALDRANNAMISGAKRRIEEYALSLSMPSMLIFGLGILLPLMVGSFMPMLSWNLWSVKGMSDGPNTGGGTSVQMVFVMNVLFPAMASLVAMNAVSGHPFADDRGAMASSRRRSLLGLPVAVASSVGGMISVTMLFSGLLMSILLLISIVAPASIWLLSPGKGLKDRCGKGESGLEDALFKTGARMLEGENFESSLHKACEDAAGPEASAVKRLSFKFSMMGLEDIPASGAESGFGVSNALEGVRVARLAASKDELAAGMLAMDIAAYLKDFRDLETALKNRLRPTISMMKTTALVLAPIVLGVTYAIYLSLASMIGGQAQGTSAEEFFLVLGLFLAEMDAIVVYFVWGIEGKGSVDSMASTLGCYMLVSEAIFSATAFLASG